MASILARSKIQEAGYYVVCEQSCCFHSLQNRLYTNDKITFKIIGILEGLDIIIIDPNTNKYKIIITEIYHLEKKLDLLFDLHRRKYPNPPKV